MAKPRARSQGRGPPVVAKSSPAAVGWTARAPSPSARRHCVQPSACARAAVACSGGKSP